MHQIMQGLGISPTTGVMRTTASALGLLSPPTELNRCINLPYSAAFMALNQCGGRAVGQCHGKDAARTVKQKFLLRVCSAALLLVYDLLFIKHCTDEPLWSYIPA